MTHDEKIVEAVARAIARNIEDERFWDAPGFQHAARAAITAYQAEAWQPRATVPRDAMVLVVCAASDKNRTFAGRRDVVPVYVDSDGNFDLNPENEFWEVTHWQPLPPAPNPPASP